MFFWVQNGLSSPRTPTVKTMTVPKITGIKETRHLDAFDPERDSPIVSEPSPRHLFQNPKTAYADEELSQNESPLLFASQVMSSPVFTLQEDSLIEEAKSYFLEKRFRHIPITNERRKLVGIISDRDILRSIADSKPKHLISEIMAERVLTGSLQTEIRFAAKVMLDERVGCLPIIDSDAETIGIITRTDLIRAIVKFPGFTLLA